MDFLRKQVDRVTEAFREVLIADQSAPVDAPWTTHDANIALYSALTQPSNSTRREQPIRPALPPEIVLQILEHPSRFILTSSVSLDSTDNLPKSVPSHRAPQEVIRSSPLSANNAKDTRKVVFEMTGKDQGWSSYGPEHGTYNNTWTWYDAVVLRKNGEDSETYEEALRQELHRNRHAGQQVETYRTEFDGDHDLVKMLREGDVIALDACAVFDGWECRVYGATIEVWSVDDLSSTPEIRGK